APAVSGKRRRRRLVGGVGLEADPYRDPAVVHVGAGKAGPALGVRFTELDAERALGAARQKADVVRPAVRGPLARVALGARAGRLGVHRRADGGLVLGLAAAAQGPEQGLVAAQLGSLERHVDD